MSSRHKDLIFLNIRSLQMSDLRRLVAPREPNNCFTLFDISSLRFLSHYFVVACNSRVIVEIVGKTHTAIGYFSP